MPRFPPPYSPAGNVWNRSGARFAWAPGMSDSVSDRPPMPCIPPRMPKRTSARARSVRLSTVNESCNRAVDELHPVTDRDVDRLLVVPERVVDARQSVVVDLDARDVLVATVEIRGLVAGAGQEDPEVLTEPRFTEDVHRRLVPGDPAQVPGDFVQAQGTRADENFAIHRSPGPTSAEGVVANKAAGGKLERSRSRSGRSWM